MPRQEATGSERAAARASVLGPARERVTCWVVDDTGMFKRGKHSPGAQRQYTGSAGKIANCRLSGRRTHELVLIPVFGSLRHDGRRQQSLWMSIDSASEDVTLPRRALIASSMFGADTPARLSRYSIRRAKCALTA